MLSLCQVNVVISEKQKKKHMSQENRFLYL